MMSQNLLQHINSPTVLRQLDEKQLPQLARELRDFIIDIVSIKELLGHANIETTMVYLHIAKTGRKAPFCPLDNLYKV